MAVFRRSRLAESVGGEITRTARRPMSPAAVHDRTRANREAAPLRGEENKEVSAFQRP